MSGHSVVGKSKTAKNSRWQAKYSLKKSQQSFSYIQFEMCREAELAIFFVSLVIHSIFDGMEQNYISFCLFSSSPPKTVILLVELPKGFLSRTDCLTY